MATKQLSELPEATQLDAEDLFLVQQGGVAKKVRRKVLAGGAGIAAISVTEAADGTVTMVNKLESGTETIVISPDANGNPNSLTYNGTAIPVEWTEATA